MIAAMSSGSVIGYIVPLAVAVFIIAAWWTVFTKAGQPGWGAIIPIYNVYLMCKVGGKPGWWVILFFIPLLNIVMAFVVMIGIAKNFGKGAGFGVGIVFLQVIFVPILGFGSATYQKSLI